VLGLELDLEVGGVLGTAVERREGGLGDQRVGELVLERLVQIEVRVVDLTVAAAPVLAPRLLDSLEDIVRARESELERERLDRDRRDVLDVEVMRADRFGERVRANVPALEGLEVSGRFVAIEQELEVAGCVGAFHARGL
jgi:hypothetical protein